MKPNSSRQVLQIARMRKFSCSAALNCRLFAAPKNILVTNDEKYQTCLMFGLHVTIDENAVNVAAGLRN